MSISTEPPPLLTGPGAPATPGMVPGTGSPEARPGSIAELLADGGPEPEAPLRRVRFPWAILLGCLLLGGGAVAAPWIAARVGPGAATAPVDLLTHTVQRGALKITVTEDGSLASDENVDIVCGVGGGATIVWLIDDGAQVTAGTELVKLDDSTLSESVTAQRIAHEKARAACITAEKDYAAATIAVQEYEEGTYKKDLRKAESDVKAAGERLQACRNGLEHGQRMFRKGYIAPQQLESLEATVERARLDLGTTEIALDVLQRFARPKMTTELTSKRDAAAAKRDAEKAALELEEAKLERLTGQLERCVLKAPKDGLVIYANERSYDATSEIKVGTKVNEGTTILRLPDLSRMRANVEVHESKVDRIRTGMKARLRVQGRPFDGVVSAVSNRPQSNWYSSAKKYVVQVRIEGEAVDLRPGLTAEVEIIVAELADVVTVPVAAVVEQAGRTWCGVRTATGVERREVTLGQGNDMQVVIERGLEPGEVVVLDPREILGEPPAAAG